MKWTTDHVWVLEKLISSRSYFLYKYVVIRDGKIKRWEKGTNRIADLSILPNLSLDDAPFSEARSQSSWS